MKKKPNLGMPLALIAYRHAWVSAHVPCLISQAEWEKEH